MQILYIIGNGFDINLGMKTRYSDFYEYYKAIDSDDESIKKLKTALSEDFKNWSDLELAFGRYTENIPTSKEFDFIFEDIGDKLSDYLDQEEGKINLKGISGSKFLSYLGNPEDHLLEEDREALIEYKNNDYWKTKRWSVNIVTFNYTKTIEKIVGGGTYIAGPNGRSMYLDGISHVHGFTKDRMVLGVNDTSQIGNNDFHKQRDILEALVKTDCNKANQNTAVEFFRRKIQITNLICIFGSSLGETDNYWWELIGKRLKDHDLRVIIFTKGEEIKPRAGYKKARIAREIKELFFTRTKLSPQDITKVESKVYVAVNADIFNLK